MPYNTIQMIYLLNAIDNYTRTRTGKWMLVKGILIKM